MAQYFEGMASEARGMANGVDFGGGGDGKRSGFWADFGDEV